MCLSLQNIHLDPVLTKALRTLVSLATASAYIWPSPQLEARGGTVRPEIYRFRNGG
ncbi:hypothetical protein K438DRAFT_1860862 [Mycena galopus ATCC 62051]|nr:hypothetical protein K438DRAFT_1860862 [Mycena galopus ATCC 62051]